MLEKIKEQFIEAAITLLHAWKKGLKTEEMDEWFQKLNEIAHRSDSLGDNVCVDDIRDSIGFVCMYLSKDLKDIGDEEFTKYVEDNVLSVRTYHFYYPIYGLYRFPENIQLGVSNTFMFNSLPEQVQKDFEFIWEHHFEKNTEYAQTVDEYVSRKKASAFLHLTVVANGSHRAMEKAIRSAEDSVHIIRFLYGLHFPINECRYTIEGSKSTGGMESYGQHFHGSATYVEFFACKFPELTEILIKRDPTVIEKKLRNALRIFGIQTSITNDQVRYVLLVTCLESLLLTGSDRDYILWKLAEKTALLIGKNKRYINDYVKSAYNKRSAFIHGEYQERNKSLEEKDVGEIEGLVHGVFWKLMELKKKGYTEIQKKDDRRSIDECIEEMKFGKE